MGTIIHYGRHIKKRERKNMFEEIKEEMRAQPSVYTNYTPRQASQTADRILEIAEQLGYNGKTATPIVHIVKEFGINAYCAPNMNKDISGTIFINGKTEEVYGHNKIILTDKFDPMGHQHFVLAHELGHYLFDYLGNPKYSDPTLLFECAYPKKNHDSEIEIRADRFAAELLMPYKLFREQYNMAMNCKENRYKERIFTIIYLAKFFRVRKSSVEKRIKEVLYDGGY